MSNFFPYETLTLVNLPKIGRLFWVQVLEIVLGTVIGNSDIQNGDIFYLKVTTRNQILINAIC